MFFRQLIVVVLLPTFCDWWRRLRLACGERCGERNWLITGRFLADRKYSLLIQHSAWSESESVAFTNSLGARMRYSASETDESFDVGGRPSDYWVPPASGTLSSLVTGYLEVKRSRVKVTSLHSTSLSCPGLKFWTHRSDIIKLCRA